MPDKNFNHPSLFVAACLATLIYVPIAQHLLPSGEEGGWRAGPFAELGGAIAPADGKAWGLAANRELKRRLDNVERQLEDVSHVRSLLLPSVQWLLTSTAGIGNESVYPGREDWLILRQGFDYLVGPSFLEPIFLERRRRSASAWRPVPEPDPRPAIFDFAHQLAERGIRLLVLPAPTKMMVHPEALYRPRVESTPAPSEAAGGAPALDNPSFASFRAELEAGGVDVLSVAAILRQAQAETGVEQFLRTDSHWSPAGVEVAARVLADTIQQLDLPFNGPGVTWRRQQRTVTGVGDLERSLGLPGWRPLYTPQEVDVKRVVTGSGRPWQPDSRAEILLLGDSFTNVYSQPDVGWGRSAGLAEHLSFYLKRPVDRLAINAGGASATRRRLAQEMAAGKDRLAGKKLVIWQFAIRELAVGDWELVQLPASLASNLAQPRFSSLRSD